MVDYRKGEQLEREGDPARWFAYVERGCFTTAKKLFRSAGITFLHQNMKEAAQP